MSERYIKESDAERAARRRFLKRASLLLGAGLGGPAAAKAAMRRTVDIEDIPVGGAWTVLFSRVPVFILNRSRETLTALERNEGELVDPESRRSQQPSFALNPWRSSVPEWLVMVNVCTHAGCHTRYESRPGSEAGEFHCPCHGARYDAAGRIFNQQPTSWNMAIPDYEIDVAHKRIHLLSVEPLPRNA